MCNVFGETVWEEHHICVLDVCGSLPRAFFCQCTIAYFRHIHYFFFQLILFSARSSSAWWSFVIHSPLKRLIEHIPFIMIRKIAYTNSRKTYQRKPHVGPINLFIQNRFTIIRYLSWKSFSDHTQRSYTRCSSIYYTTLIVSHWQRVSSSVFSLRTAGA